MFRRKRIRLRRKFYSRRFSFWKTRARWKSFFDDQIIPVDDYGNFLLGLKESIKINQL